MRKSINEVMKKHMNMKPGRLVPVNDMKRLIADTIGTMTRAPLAMIKTRTKPAGKVLASVVTATAQGIRSPKSIEISAIAASDEITATVTIGHFKRDYVAETIDKLVVAIRTDKAVASALDD